MMPDSGANVIHFHGGDACAAPVLALVEAGWSGEEIVELRAGGSVA
jgi:hypothetical protein